MPAANSTVRRKRGRLGVHPALLLVALVAACLPRVLAQVCSPQTITVTKTVTLAAPTSTTASRTTISKGATGTSFITSVRPSSSSSAAAPPPPLASPTNWWKPELGSKFLWSLESQIPVNPKSSSGLSLDGMSVYGVDLFDTSAAQIKDYHARGKKVVCYFSAGSFEAWRPDAKDFSPACYCNKGSSCKMDGWDEYWLDIRSSACIKNVGSVMSKRIALAASKGCDAVEPDNTDSYLNKPGWKTTIADQYNFLESLTTTAHTHGLGIALKNGVDMIKNRRAVVDMHDFVIIEQCAEYGECAGYKPFVDAKKPAYQIEYERSIKCTMPGFFLLSYNSFNVDYKNIVDFCSA